jgi:hypothetical protein
MVSEEIQRLRAKLDGLVREQADRQELLDRQGKEIQAKGQEYMTKQAQAAEKYLAHRRELGQREREAGGWATEKSLADKSKNNVMGFGPEDPAEQEEERFGARSTESFTPRRTEPETPEAPETTDRVAPPPAPERRGRHSRRDEFDEDDFSNNSYLG